MKHHLNVKRKCMNIYKSIKINLNVTSSTSTGVTLGGVWCNSDSKSNDSHSTAPADKEM